MSKSPESVISLLGYLQKSPNPTDGFYNQLERMKAWYGPKFFGYAKRSGRNNEMVQDQYYTVNWYLMEKHHVRNRLQAPPVNGRIISLIRN